MRRAMAACHDRAASAGGGRSVCALVTGLLHYMLTRALVPSQRKVAFRGVELDIVVPDLRTLEARPAGAVVVCIMESADPGIAAARLAEADMIQPVAANIWAALPGSPLPGRKSFTISGDGASLSGLVPELGRFAGSSGLRILGS